MLVIFNKITIKFSPFLVLVKSKKSPLGIFIKLFFKANILQIKLFFSFKWSLFFFFNIFSEYLPQKYHLGNIPPAIFLFAKRNLQMEYFFKKSIFKFNHSFYHLKLNYTFSLYLLQSWNFSYKLGSASSFYLKNYTFPAFIFFFFCAFLLFLPLILNLLLFLLQLLFISTSFSSSSYFYDSLFIVLFSYRFLAFSSS